MERVRRRLGAVADGGRKSHDDTASTSGRSTTPGVCEACTNTTTPDEAFVLDRVGPVVAGAGFSGQGFKFAPGVGATLADLALDAAALPAPAFRLR